MWCDRHHFQSAPVLSHTLNVPASHHPFALFFHLILEALTWVFSFHSSVTIECNFYKHCHSFQIRSAHCFSRSSSSSLCYLVIVSRASCSLSCLCKHFEPASSVHKSVPWNIEEAERRLRQSKSFPVLQHFSPGWASLHFVTSYNQLHPNVASKEKKFHYLFQIWVWEMRFRRR